MAGAARPPAACLWWPCAPPGRTALGERGTSHVVRGEGWVETVEAAAPTKSRSCDAEATGVQGGLALERRARHRQILSRGARPPAGIAGSAAMNRDHAAIAV